MEQIHTSDSASRNYSWLSIMDKVCTLTTTCLETCILWPYGDLRFFRRPVCERRENTWHDTGCVTRKHTPVENAQNI